MSTITVPHAGHHHEAPLSHNAVAEFVTSWYEATPAAILLRPVGAFLKAWFHATPVSIALRMMSH
ncbi:hypothetical protein ACIU1J_02980 [Azospirillum doebereinerae]|uniref:hypothetical protein n=1 Tax=Azospirillum doebereinerae TaxID=92933 RepID=UPI001EE61096|nr:hypothetical protein [Azospirillum doebereinerae]MCG5241748.1 hypothetical protein [Azospirillum doebereinerae]